MDPIIGGLITGGASLLGNIFSSSTSASNTQAQIAAQEAMQGQTQQFNAQQADINRQFQTQMSNTAYQRSTADMKAAGLNPMMMFGSGGPASVPSGGAASVGTPSVPMPTRTSPLGNLGDVVTKAVSSAGAVVDMNKRVADTDLTRQQTETEKSRSLDAANQAAKSGLGLPAARREAAEEGFKAALPESVRRQVAQSPYVGQGYGKWGSEIATPTHTIVNGLSEAVGKLVDQATGPSGRSMWDSARNAAGRVWDVAKPRAGVVGDIKQGASDMYDEFRKIRGTTLNPDWR